VAVALGDTTGSGSVDVITGAGPGGSPLVNVIDGTTNTTKLSFFAYDSTLRSGIEVAAGDVNGDGVADIVTVAQWGGPNIVRVFDGRNAQLLSQFLAMGPTWTHGLHVAAGDGHGGGRAGILVASGLCGGPPPH